MLTTSTFFILNTPININSPKLDHCAKLKKFEYGNMYKETTTIVEDTKIKQPIFPPPKPSICPLYRFISCSAPVIFAKEVNCLLTPEEVLKEEQEFKKTIIQSLETQPKKDTLINCSHDSLLRSVLIPIS